MKKLIAALLAAVLLTCALSGCADAGKSAYTADNEIFTYERIDPQKTQLVVSKTGNTSLERLVEKFEAQNPDIQVTMLDVTGGSMNYKPLADWIKKTDIIDVIVTTGAFFDAEDTIKYIEDLSEQPIIQNYETAALQRTAVGGNIYWLPGPSDIGAMTYNKTLFEQYGWEPPVTFDEFIALCERIRADTGGAVEPWNPNAKYSDELTTAIEAMTYEELLGGVENRMWYDDYLAGRTTFAGHMEPYAQVIQTLIDHDLLREEHFTYSATTRGKEFAAGKIAMVNGAISQFVSDEFKFAAIPFPTTKGDIGYLCDNYSCLVGVPKYERSKEKSEAIDRFLAYFTSPEGQRAYIGDTLKLSNVKGVALDAAGGLETLQQAVDAGNMFGRMDFVTQNVGYRVADLYGIATDLLTGGMTPEQSIANVDARRIAAQAAPPEETPEVVAVADKDFTVLETSFLIADAYRAAAGADIGLIANNIAYRGNLIRLFAGELTSHVITVLKPRSFGNDATLVKLSLTGQQLLDALNAPQGNEKTADCIYAYSGLKCEVAPWAPLGSKYLSVKLADGSAIEPDKLYTVAAWAGTVQERYISETLTTYEGTWEELISAQLKAKGHIAPAKDGRIRLVWKAADGE